MEIQGIPSSGQSQQNIDTTVSGAMGSVYSVMIDYLKDIEINTDETLNALKSNFKDGLKNNTVVNENLKSIKKSIDLLKLDEIKILKDINKSIGKIRGYFEENLSSINNSVNVVSIDSSSAGPELLTLIKIEKSIGGLFDLYKSEVLKDSTIQKISLDEARNALPKSELITLLSIRELIGGLFDLYSKELEKNKDVNIAKVNNQTNNKNSLYTKGLQFLIAVRDKIGGLFDFYKDQLDQGKDKVVTSDTINTNSNTSLPTEELPVLIAIRDKIGGLFDLYKDQLDKGKDKVVTSDTINSNSNTSQSSPELNILIAIKDSVGGLFELYKSEIESKSTLNTQNTRTQNDPNSELLSAIRLNTNSIDHLNYLIKSTQLEIKITGKNDSYFQQLTQLLSKDRSIAALEKISKVYESAVIRMANLEKYAVRIEKTASSMVMAFGTFSKIGKGLLILSGGLALLGITLATFVAAVTVGDLAMFAGIILTLRLASEISEGAAKDFALLSVSIGLLGLAVWAFSEFLDADMTLGFIGKVIAIGGAVLGLSKVYSYVGKNSASIMNGSKNVVAMAGSLFLLGLSLDRFPEINIVNMAKLGVTLFGLSKVYDMIGKSPTTLQGALGVVAIGGSLAVMAFGLNELSTVKISGEHGLSLIAAFLAAASLVTLVGNPVTIGFTYAGAAGVAAVGASLWVMSKGLNALNTVKVTEEQAKVFGRSVLNVVGALASMGNPLVAAQLTIATPAALALATATWSAVKSVIMVSELPNMDISKFDNFRLGLGKLIQSYDVLTLKAALKISAAAPVTLAMLSSTWLTTKSMKLVSEVPPIDLNHYENFKQGLTKMIDVYSVLGLKSSLKILGSTVVTGAMLVSSMNLRAAMYMVSKMTILRQEHYDNFKYALEQMVGAYKGIGLWGATKATAAASVITILAGASTASATAIRAFTAISNDPTQVSSAISSMDFFITGFVDVFEKNSSRIDKVAPGIKAFYGIGNMGKGIAETVKAMAKMEFEDKEVDANGKVIKRSSTKIGSNELALVGQNIGRIISALTEPLANVGSQKDTFKIGGFTITNPFSNKVKNGIGAMSKIGNVISPLVEVIKVFNSPENKIDDAFVLSFNKNFSSLLNTIGTSFKTTDSKLGKMEFKNMINAAATIKILTGAISQSNFEKGSGVFSKVTGDIGIVKSHLNGMDLNKLTRFNSMLGHLVDLQKTRGMEELVRAFKEFIQTFIDFTEVRERETKAAEERAKQLDEIKQMTEQNLQNSQNNLLTQPTQQLQSPFANIQPPQQRSQEDDKMYYELSQTLSKLLAMFNSVDGAKVKITNGNSPYFKL